MTLRTTALHEFLAESGWGDAAINRLAGDASNRSYSRLTRNGQTAMLMDAPPERGEDVRPFVAVTDWLRQNDYSAPQILAADISNGFLLLEDLGDNLYSRHIRHAQADETMLYERAVDLLADLACRPVPQAMGHGDAATTLAPYDHAVLEREALLILEWWIPAVRGEQVGLAEREGFQDILARSVKAVADARDAVVLRDYHADNLIWLPERDGLAAVGLLDYQDALAGHAAYDLVSLLEDARRDTPAELRGAMIRRYLDRRPELDAEAFQAAYAVLGAQRNLKIIGIFARLALRDGKTAYLKMIPRVWQHVLNDLEHPELAELRNWVMAHVSMPEHLEPGSLRAPAR